MFLFLVDGNRSLDNPTNESHAGMFRIFILRNSKRRRRTTLTLNMFPLSFAPCARTI